MSQSKQNKPRTSARRSGSTRNGSGESSHNTVRIIAGQWRGRKLPVADIDGLRPTGDRIRETLFNWLDPYLAGSRCLDLYAGSGALSFEALSRGSAHVTALDSSQQVISSLKSVAHILSTDDLQPVYADANTWLKGSAQGLFDIVFLDPPFQAGLLDDSVAALVAANCLTPDALIYIERASHAELLQLPDNWQLHKDKVAGKVRFGLYRLIA